MNKFMTKIKKKGYLICTVLILVSILYSAKVSYDLHELKESYNNRQKMIMNEHILSFSLFDELNGNDLLKTEYPQIEIQYVIDKLKLAEISNKHLFEADGIFIGYIYTDYIYLLEIFKNEYIKTHTIKDKNKFNDVIEDLDIIKNWLEDRYHNDNFNPYTYREFKEKLSRRLKYANFE